jgi:hypothetical protein
MPGAFLAEGESVESASRSEFSFLCAVGLRTVGWSVYADLK